MPDVPEPVLERLISYAYELGWPTGAEFMLTDMADDIRYARAVLRAAKHHGVVQVQHHAIHRDEPGRFNPTRSEVGRKLYYGEVVNVELPEPEDPDE